MRTDDGRSVSFDLKDYDRIDHGYAATIHKAQGMTVDRAHVLATPGMDEGHAACRAVLCSAVSFHLPFTGIAGQTLGDTM